MIILGKPQTFASRLNFNKIQYKTAFVHIPKLLECELF